MPGQRHGPVQGKLHPASGAGIELPASLRKRLRRERCRSTDGRMTPAPQRPAPRKQKKDVPIYLNGENMYIKLEILYAFNIS